MKTYFFIPLLLIIIIISSSSAIPTANITLENIDPTLPPALTACKPKCSVLALSHHFGHTIDLPPVSANYTHPASCPAPWSRVILELSAVASGPQKDRVAAVWVAGSEILRTSTPYVTKPGTFWKVYKDVTRYTDAIRRLSSGNSTISMMLPNSNATLPGVYHFNLTFHFYRGVFGSYSALPSVRSLYGEPADVIIPISNENGLSDGYWFKVLNATHIPSATVSIPRNAYRAVLEIFPSYHGSDQNWYRNPLRSEYDCGSGANGGFRQVYATIDGKFVGGHIPFAVVYPGAVNPFFWSPVAAIGAFDMPSYDLDVTPFLGQMVDGKTHEIGIGVKYALSHWLVTGNLHLWIDKWSDVVEGDLMVYNAPKVKLTRHGEWGTEDGTSEIIGDGLVKFVGWVNSSKGNLTTMVRQKIKFKSQIEVQNRGTVTQIELINKERMAVGITTAQHQILGRVQLFVEAPLQIQTSNVNAIGGALFERTRLSHQLEIILNLNDNQVVTSSTLSDQQDAEGSALMHEGSPVWGSGRTTSLYKYRDENNCYLRTVETEGGIVKDDNASPSCSATGES